MNSLKEIAFFDLDNTLWYIKSNAWVIHKNNPAKPLMKISNLEFTLIQNGVYIADDNVIEFNNEKYFVSNDFVERLERRKKGIKLKDVGISYAEYFDEEILNKKDVTMLLNNIKHLIGKDIEIALITARSERKKHAGLLNKLRVKMEEYGFEISKIYFVSDRIRFIGSSDKVAYNKNKVLLEHLIGLEIKDEKFIPIKKDAYNRVYFYDDIEQNFLSLNSMQEYFGRLLSNSDDEVVEYIKNRLNNETLLLMNNLITNNEVNPFETKIIKLREPLKYPISSENFRSNFIDFRRL
jgi:hypothetical protein